MKKKFIAVLMMCAFCVFAFTACAAQTDENNTNNATPTTAGNNVVSPTAAGARNDNDNNIVGGVAEDVITGVGNTADRIGDDIRNDANDNRTTGTGYNGNTTGTGYNGTNNTSAGTTTR